MLELQKDPVAEFLDRGLAHHWPDALVSRGNCLFHRSPVYRHTKRADRTSAAVPWSARKRSKELRRRQHIANSIHKFASPFAGGGSTIQGNVGVRPRLVVGNGFEIVAAL